MAPTSVPGVMKKPQIAVAKKRKPNALICRTRNGVKGEALRPISRKMRQSKKMVKPPDIEGMMKGKVPASVEGPR